MFLTFIILDSLSFVVWVCLGFWPYYKAFGGFVNRYFDNCEQNKVNSFLALYDKVKHAIILLK